MNTGGHNGGVNADFNDAVAEIFAGDFQRQIFLTTLMRAPAFRGLEAKMIGDLPALLLSMSAS